MGTCPSQLHQLHLEGIPGTWDSLGIIVSRLTRKMVFLHLIELSCSCQLFFKEGRKHTHIAAGQRLWHWRQVPAPQALCRTRHLPVLVWCCRPDGLPGLGQLGDIPGDMSPLCCAKPRALPELLVCSQLHQFNKDTTSLQPTCTSPAGGHHWFAVHLHPV